MPSPFLRCQSHSPSTGPKTILPCASYEIATNTTVPRYCRYRPVMVTFVPPTVGPCSGDTDTRNGSDTRSLYAYGNGALARSATVTTRAPAHVVARNLIA